MHAIGIMQNYNELTQKLNFLSLMIEQYEGGLQAVGEGSEEAAKFQGMLDELNKAYSVYGDLVVKIGTNIDQFQGLEYKIAKLYYIDGFTLRKVAKKVGRTYGYIRRIHSDMMSKENELNEFLKAN